MVSEPKVTLDIKAIPHDERDPQIIFRAFESLASGEKLLIINDHDPKPLRERFASRMPGGFEWAYLEEGPETWRVEITRN